MALGYALFHAGKYYQIRNVEGLLRMMRGNTDFREAMIEMLKGYCYVTDKVDELVDVGYLEVGGEPGKVERMDEMTKNFAMLVKREFSEEWEKIEIVKKE